MKKITITILLLSIFKIAFTQNELTNSFENLYLSSKISYRYIETSQTHDYSGNWDFDGDGINDSLLFVGTGGAHQFYVPHIYLSSEKRNFDFDFLSIDYPVLQDLDVFVDNENVMQGFFIYDFSKDGISDIYLKMDETRKLPDELRDRKSVV